MVQNEILRTHPTRGRVQVLLNQKWLIARTFEHSVIEGVREVVRESGPKRRIRYGKFSPVVTNMGNLQKKSTKISNQST